MADVSSIDAVTIGKGIESGSNGLAKLFPGWVRRSETNAEISATKKAIESIGEIRRLARAQGLDDEVTDYFCRDMVRRVTRNENIDAIISFASPMVENDANPQDLVGSEWLNYYVDHAERVTEEEVQRAWAAILAGEVNKPGTYSKMAISTLSRMDAKDIKNFKMLCSFLSMTQIDEVLVVSADGGGTSYNEGAFTYQQLSSLGTMGLVDMGGSYYLTMTPKQWTSFISSNDCVVLVRGVEGHERISFHPVLTRTGQELSKLCKDRNNRGILKALNAKCRKGELALEFMRASDGQDISFDDAASMLAL